MPPNRRLAAVVFTDIEGFTSITNQDEPAALSLIAEQNAIVDPLLETYHGRRVKSIGDGLLLEFPNALDALECMVRVQEAVRARNANDREPALRLRVGVHLGDVVGEGEDILGDSVNIASRIEALSEPGGVCLSGPVFDQVRNKVLHRFVGMGSRRLKGIDVPIDVYRVEFAGERGRSRPVSVKPPRIAILPFMNISPNPADEYLADGLTEELISVTSQIRSLRVVSAASINAYRETRPSLRQVGRDLGVTVVIQGSVRKQGDHLRIVVHVADVESEEERWSQTYDRQLGDVFGIQAEIAAQTARVLRLELQEAEGRKLGRAPTSDLGAYELYLQAIHHANRRVAGLEQAIPLLEAAVERDPGFALAHSYLANLLIGAAGETRSGPEAFRQAEGLIARALQLEPESSDAHSARGNLMMQAQGDWAAAESSFRRALALNPSDAGSHYWYSMLLWALQRFPEAKDHAIAALELNPRDAYAKLNLSGVYESLGEFDLSLTLLRELSEDLPEEVWPLTYLCAALITQGRTAEARRTLDRLSTAETLPRLSTREFLSARLGDLEPAQVFLTKWENQALPGYVSAEDVALLYATVGDREKALELLERQVAAGHIMLWIVYQHPVFDSIREDPRFADLLRKAKLPTTIGWRRAESRIRDPK